ncbi:hypothetical protein CALVIDRAFT_8603 [Calocera viscosa TUFC12733]|uniref:Actin binding protein n=1 Tax=Calocera viscosa (strain TUFC12733) TaxID=1330018 RepID=A0A167S2N3_CALVF|nr:hypothetical protein CALVIDRAFT_8603 [Calocera viscosa TUFC12733]
MSLQLNLNSPEIAEAYKEVLNGDPSTNWVLFTYEGRSNDLKVQDTGSGGLEELEDSFNDGRIQFAYVRVKDPNSGLTKFVQINWCGDGVPESRKGLFQTHSATLTDFLKVVHVQVAARSEADVDPDIILKRVADASGSKYSVHNEQIKAPEPIAPIRGSGYQPTGKVDIGELRKGARPAEPIAPIKPAYQPIGKVDVDELRKGVKPEEPIAPVVGSGYKPVGRVDIDELRKGARPAPAPAPVVGSGYQPIGKVDIGELRRGARPDEPIAPVVGSGYQPTGKVDIAELRKGARPDEPIAPVGTVYTPPREELSNFKNLANPPPPPAAPRPTPAAASPAPPTAPRPAVGGFNPRPAFSTPPAPAAAPQPVKPAEDDRIGPVGTAYTPVSLAAPKKLVNPFANRMQQEEKPPALSPASTGPKKLTWSERQAAAKKQQEEEDARTTSLAERATSTAGTVSETAVAGAGFAVGAIKGATQALRDAVGDTIAPPPPAAPRPPVPVRQDTDEQQDEEWPEDEAPPVATSAPAAPPPSPSAPRPTAAAAPVEAAAPPPPPPPPAPPSADELEEVTTQVATMQVAESHPPGPKAIVTFSYEAAEGNEIDLNEGETIYGVEQLDEGWWSATTASGKTGLFPANYVELLEDDAAAESAAPPAPPPPPAPVAEPEHEELAAPAPPPPPPAAPRPTAAEPAKPFAIAQFEYEAAEDNEISFAEGQKIIDLEFVSDDWWSGRVEGGAQGLFPANYVELQE